MTHMCYYTYIFSYIFKNNCSCHDTSPCVLSRYDLRARTFSYKIKVEGLGRWLREARAWVQMPRTNAKPSAVARISSFQHYHSRTGSGEISSSLRASEPGMLRQLTRDPALTQSVGWGQHPRLSSRLHTHTVAAHARTPTSILPVTHIPRVHIVYTKIKH